MDAGAICERLRDPLSRRKRGESIALNTGRRVGAQQHRPARVAVTGARVADQANGKVGIADASVDAIVLLPEAALELQADLDRGDIGNRIDSVAKRRAHGHLDLVQDRQWNGAEAPVGGGCQRLARIGGILVDDGQDRKSTRLNSSHDQISYAVFCLKKKKIRQIRYADRHEVSFLVAVGTALAFTVDRDALVSDPARLTPEVRGNLFRARVASLLESGFS